MKDEERTLSVTEKGFAESALDLLRKFEEDESSRSRAAMHGWAAVDDDGEMWLYLAEPVRDAAGIWLPGIEHDDAWRIGTVAGHRRETWARTLFRRSADGWEAVPAEVFPPRELSGMTEDERLAHIARLEELSSGEIYSYITALHTLYTHRYGDAYLRTVDRGVLHMDTPDGDADGVYEAAEEFIRSLP